MCWGHNPTQSHSNLLLFYEVRNRINLYNLICLFVCFVQVTVRFRGVTGEALVLF